MAKIKEKRPSTFGNFFGNKKSTKKISSPLLFIGTKIHTHLNSMLPNHNTFIENNNLFFTQKFK